MKDHIETHHRSHGCYSLHHSYEFPDPVPVSRGEVINQAAAIANMYLRACVKIGLTGNAPEGRAVLSALWKRERGCPVHVA